MAVFSRTHFLLFTLIISTGAIFVVSGTVFTLENNCNYTVWLGTLTGNGAPISDGGFPLYSGSFINLTAPSGWSGRFWGRTGCNFDSNGTGTCVTGDCGGVLKCIGGGAPPATLAEFTIGDMDFYDVSLVDGYNVQMTVTPRNGGKGDCQIAGCVSDVNAICPKELRVSNASDVAGVVVVACKSACEAFNKPEYCCTGEFATPESCPATRYSKMFKEACPKAYSYAYDDATSTCTCTGSDYLITFCPKPFIFQPNFAPKLRITFRFFILLLLPILL